METLQRAMTLHQQGHLTEARGLYERVLSLDSGDAQAMTYLAVLLMQAGEPAAAVEWFRKTLRVRPNDCALYIHLGSALSALNRPEEAISAYDRAIAIDSESNATPFYGRASALCQLGRFAEAISSYDRAIALESDLDAHAWYGRGVALLELGRPAEAVESFDKTIELGTAFVAESHVGRGLALAGLNRHHAALESFDAAIQFVPENAVALKGRGSMLAALHRYDDARQSLEHSLAIVATDAEAHNNLGLVLARLGKAAAALEHFERASELDGRLAKARLNASAVLRQLKRFESALGHCDSVLELYPELALAHANRACILADIGRLAESLAASNRAIELQPAAAEVWMIRAEVLKQGKNLVSALAAADRAVQLRPQYPEALYLRGSILYKLSDAPAAAAAFREVLACDPSFLPARMGLAITEIPVMPRTADEAAAAPARFGAAIADLERWLAMNPGIDATELVGALLPFGLAYLGHDVNDELSRHGHLCARAMAGWQQREGLARMVAPRAAQTKLKVGIFSSHISDHSVFNAITRGWLERLDREHFTVEIYYEGSKVDVLTRAAQSLADHFEQGPRSTREWLQLIQDRRPDVLIYPEVGMDQATLQLASLRLAERQFAAWGHPITTGLPTIDCFISADAFEPPDADAHYNERLVRLPRLGVYLEPPSRATAATSVARPQNRGPHLVCAGTPWKYAPEHDWVIVEIARRLGRCQLHYFEYTDGRLTHLLRERWRVAFAAAGLDAADFLVAHRWMRAAEFGAFLSRADLYLDTLGFSGFNTVMQALNSGLPVVSFRGRYMRGRFGSGILDALSAGALVSDSVDAYIDSAVALAVDVDACTQWREHFRARLPNLYNDQSAIDGLEALLRESC